MVLDIVVGPWAFAFQIEGDSLKATHAVSIG